MPFWSPNEPKDFKLCPKKNNGKTTPAKRLRPAKTDNNIPPTAVNCPDPSFQQITDFNSYITSANQLIPPQCTPNGPCDALMNDILNPNSKMDDKSLGTTLWKMSQDDLKAQIKYNLAQLSQCNAKPYTTPETHIFGTLDWWKANVWGANKILNYTYIVSFVLMFVGIIFVVYSLGKDLYQDIIRTKHFIIMAVAAGISLLIFFIISLTTSFSDKPYIDFNQIYNSIVNYTTKINNNIYSYSKFNASEGDYIDYYKSIGYQLSNPQSIISWLFVITLLILCSVMGLALYKLRRTVGGVPRQNLTPIGYILFGLLLGLIVGINMYLTVLVPYILIILIILQNIAVGSVNFNLYVGIVVMTAIFIVINSIIWNRDKNTQQGTDNVYGITTLIMSAILIYFAFIGVYKGLGGVVVDVFNNYLLIFMPIFDNLIRFYNV